MNALSRVRMEARRRTVTVEQQVQENFFSFARIFVDTAGCDRRQGSLHCSDRLRGAQRTRGLDRVSRRPKEHIIRSKEKRKTEFALKNS